MPAQKDAELPSVRLVSYYQPANRAGGDWWWYHQGANGNLQVYLGDVTGHGAGPAMITATIAGALRFGALTSTAKDRQNYEVLKNLSSGLFEVAQGEYWMTMNLLDVNSEGTLAKLWFAAATDVYILQKNGDLDTYNSSSSHLGIENGKIETVEVELQPGNRIFLVTDGIVEQIGPSGNQMGSVRWVKALKKTMGLPLKEARDNLIEFIHKARGDVPVGDDMCFIIVEVK